ncbi:hypothetical protein LTR56_010823 [Elasticomyces elasticus]|nr:hypothetical protein LTR56_010823 [Elasticomyces elasticus]KAK3650303.1 hypothetical protein LTR22_012630 [Elasticomyces elasticus]KAK4932314.1 hypothetical protein LTR49_001183 [Elasticomyces elasticus]KAK5768322.1 hypothetical protein LTS12_001461 [Elasticomyces elasticus]
MASTTGPSVDHTTESKMATASVMAAPGLPTAAFKPIIVQSQAMKRKLEHVDFTPREHLAFEEPESVLMMTDIGFSEDTGVSPVAVSHPFRLFTPECIQKFRDEVLSEEVLEKCSYKSNLAAMQLRGYAPKYVSLQSITKINNTDPSIRYAPFTHAAWHDPATLAIVSKIAGVDLIPNMDFEIGHINVSVKSEKQALAEREAVESSTDGSKPWEDDKPVVGWHRDSYPFVCVTMLSDCTNMIGGETALKKADGGVLRVRGPGMGCAVVMQGRYITHQALRALGAQERITMVTSFRPKSPFLPDDSVLSTVRGISVLSDLYYEFGTYRLEMLQERIKAQLKSLKDDRAAGKKTDTKALKAFLDEQESFVHRTNSEMVRDEDVKEGHQPEMGLEDVKVVDENVQLTTPPNEEEEGEERDAKRSKVE